MTPRPLTAAQRRELSEHEKIHTRGSHGEDGRCYLDTQGVIGISLRDLILAALAAPPKKKARGK